MVVVAIYSIFTAICTEGAAQKFTNPGHIFLTPTQVSIGNEKK